MKLQTVLVLGSTLLGGFAVLACSAESKSATGEVSQLDTTDAGTDADAAAPVPTSVEFAIDTAGSGIRIGSKTFPVGAGSLLGGLQSITHPVAVGDAAATAGTCGLGVSAARSNPTFHKVRAISFPAIDAQIELCSDIAGTVGDTTSGSATVSARSARVKVKLSGAVNCEIPCVTINFASDGNADGQDYTPADGTVKLVDNNFAVPSSSCGGFVDGVLGLPSAAGRNSAVLSLQAGNPAPTCK